MNSDVIIIGGGVVGSAVAYGLVAQGQKVLMIDGADRDFRAANANFGMVWAQGKGLGMPEYQRLTRQSIDHWTRFADELEAATDVDLHYAPTGGISLCLSESEFTSRRDELARLHNQVGGAEEDWEMLDRKDLDALFPKVTFGDEVFGASLGKRDGHVNPLYLLSALQDGIERLGGEIRGGNPVQSIKAHSGGGFTVKLGNESASAEKIVIAAGLGSKRLAGQLGMDLPIRPERGQILVTERLEPFLPLPIRGLRQTNEGTVLIGSTYDGQDFDTSTSIASSVKLSASAIRRIPALANVKLVRQWAGLRTLAPDSFPIYAESDHYPGAFVALCHSGVTLAAAHATILASAIAEGRLPQDFDVFHQRRFDVPQVA